ncbi:MAG: 3-phosphoshikimate 1-carboxyvinyltransferase [Candidatus Omnitrophota bacterium]
MTPFLIRPACCAGGKLSFPGDKSIAHRAAILAALSSPKTIIRNFPANEDCLSTLNAFRRLGVKIVFHPNEKFSGSVTVTVFGKGLFSLSGPRQPVFVGDSGTTLRLLLGVLAGQDFQVTLNAGKSLSKRPMLRVTAPLRTMGAGIRAKSSAAGGSAYGGKSQKSKTEEYPPIAISGGELRPIAYKMPVASAQVKSAILLAGLYPRGKTSVIESVRSRDHTERMMKLFKADVKTKGSVVFINGGRNLSSPGEVNIPGDISSAAFFIVLGLVCKHSRLLLQNICLNPTRSGIIKVLKRMGGNIRVSGARCQVPGGEPAGNITVRHSNLKGTRIKKKEIPSLIDELPVLMVAACFAKGKSTFEGVKELRVKETDRINSMAENLTRMGADIRIEKAAGSENIIIYGTKGLSGAAVKSFGDHRTAMSMAIAGLAAKGGTLIDDINCVKKSFPQFFSVLEKATKPALR